MTSMTWYLTHGVGTIKMTDREIVLGQTEVIWDLEEIANLKYRWEPFNDPDTVDDWKKTYQGKEFSVGMKCDYQCPQPNYQHKIFHNISQEIPGFSNEGFIWFRMMPGDIIPDHADSYINYRKRLGVKLDQVYRILVFLQDWQPGFLSEVNGQAINHYPAGTYVIWPGDTRHMAGNLSRQPRYTLQITATKS